MKTKNIDESNGYVKAIKDVIGIIGEMTKGNPKNRLIDSVELIDKIIVGKNDLSILSNDDFYTIDMIDVENPTKNIAGEDALMLNPIYERNIK